MLYDIELLIGTQFSSWTRFRPSLSKTGAISALLTTWTICSRCRLVGGAKARREWTSTMCLRQFHPTRFLTNFVEGKRHHSYFHLSYT